MVVIVCLGVDHVMFAYSAGSRSSSPSSRYSYITHQAQQHDVTSPPGAGRPRRSGIPRSQVSRLCETLVSYACHCL